MQPRDLANTLIVSCQPVSGGPMDSAAFVVGFARAALDAGAQALRIESVSYVAAVREAVSAPIIGLVKRDLDDSPVRITPYVTDAEALADAGADIIAFDATDRIRPATVKALLDAIKRRGKLSMADCSNIADARSALALGADFVGSTLSGYVGDAEPVEPDLALIAAMRELTPHVIAEGRIRTPEQAVAAVRAGAAAVVVGSAITRPEHVTAWFREAVMTAFANPAAAEPVLAIDIGGTKIMAALVAGARVLEEIRIPTARDAGPDTWVADIARHVAPWKGRYSRVGIAATGTFRDGKWSALNPGTLAIPDDYPLAANVGKSLGLPTIAVNDAQAAAWGEYSHGAGGRADMVFLTISTGIGGGIVSGGRLLTGLGGSFGLLRGPSQGDAPLEDVTSGLWIAGQAKALGHDIDAAAVFESARAGDGWAVEIVRQSALRVATLCRDIQMILDPKCIVIGGGIGLSPGYVDLIRGLLVGVDPRVGPTLVAAALGRHAGVIGAAGLITQNFS